MKNGYNSSDQTFKFKWLTRDSAFLKQVYSGPLASYGVSGVSIDQPHGSAGVEATKDTADHIADAVNFAPIQQAVLAINLASANLIFAILNGNKASLSDDPAAQNTHLTPGFSYTGAKPVDTKTALAEAVAQTLQSLDKSHVGPATDAKSLSYKNLFAQTIQNFEQQGLSFIQRQASNPTPPK